MPDAGALPALSLDRLTPAVVELRRVLAHIEADTPISEADDRDLQRRQARCRGAYNRLILVTDPKYFGHPLIHEAVDLRRRADEIEEAIRIALEERREADIRHFRARFHGRQHG